MSRAGAYVELARPFTLVAPALGVVSGAVTAAGAYPPESWSQALVVYPALGALMAAVFNAGNNALNQIYDLEIDRINKPARPLPSGALTVKDAWVFTIVTYAITLLLAWLTAPGGRHECFWIVVIAVVCTYIYSVPPLRTKQRGIWANVTIADPARRPAQGRGLDDRKDDVRARAVVHRRNLRAVPRSARPRRRTSRTWRATDSAGAGRCQFSMECDGPPG